MADLDRFTITKATHFNRPAGSARRDGTMSGMPRAAQPDDIGDVSVARILHLQSAAGNLAVASLVGGGPALQRAAPGVSAVAAAAPPVSGWNADPDGKLDDPNVNPEFRLRAKAALAAAVSAGLRPVVDYAHRSAQWQATHYAAYLATKKQALAAGKPAPGPTAMPWHSWHQYGLAMDVKIVDPSGKDIEATPKMKGWEQEFTTKLAPILRSHGLEWGVKNDSGHCEYHPALPGHAVGARASELREDALREASDLHRPDDWMQFFWFYVGAGGLDPNATTVPVGDNLTSL